jgi:hypothetical protein
MQAPRIHDRKLLQSCEHYASHVAAVLIGFILMVIGIAMGVTIVLLPFGIPVGLAGLLLFVWGLYSAGPATRRPQEEPVFVKK